MIKVSNPFSSIPPLFSDLAKILAGDIEFSKSKIDSYSLDGGAYEIKPQTIIYPKNSTDIKHVISFAREYTMPITVRGQGTGTQGGALGEGIIIDTTRYFTHIRQINMLDHTITVDSGVTVRELRERLFGWKMDIPILTSQDDDATLGGLLATKSCNPSSFHYGTLRDWVEAITVVVDSGEEHRIADGITPSGRLLGIYQAIFPLLNESGPILRAAKPELSDDATGYCVWNTSIGPRQLLDQLIGSEGTLGIITSVTLRLTPYKPFTETVCIPLEDKTLLESSIAIAKHHKADHVFFYNATIIELIERYKKEVAPSFPEAEYVLAVSFFGQNKEELNSRVRSFSKALPFTENKLFVYKDATFISRITAPSFLSALLSEYTKGSHKEILTGDGLIIPSGNLSKALQSFENFLYSTGKLYAISGNVASGHISLVTLFDPNSPTFEHDVDTYTQSLFTIVKKYKGGVSARSGEGIAKTPYLSIFYNEATLSVFTEIKKAWDPLFILNPGKKLGTSLSYLKNHLSRKIV